MRRSLFTLLIIICLSCGQKKSDKTYLANYIESVKVENSLSGNPLLIVDGYIVQYNTMNDGWFLLLEEDISKVHYLEKENAENMYGQRGTNGAVLVNTKLEDQRRANGNKKKKTLYVLDGKIISKEEYEKLDQSKIIGTATITAQSAMEEFTSEKYDEVIYVSTKMPAE